MTRDDYFRFVGLAAQMRTNLDWREGQAWFNALYRAAPDLANEVRGSALDPFYRDERTATFIEWVQEHVDQDEYPS